MRKILFKTFFFLQFFNLSAQTITQKLQKAFKEFETDPQLKHAVSSLYVIDAKTGQVLFDKNAQTGMAPASTQKIITAATAFELLGRNYRYKTDLIYTGKIENDQLNGQLCFAGSGDPTLGSWRWNFTKDSSLLNKWWLDVKRAGIKRIDGSVWFIHKNFSAKTIPDGWIWQDIGNYYGAGAAMLNWKENQYDISLRSSAKTGELVEIASPDNDFVNELKSAPKNTGDNAYVYYDGVIAGTIPVGESNFKISAAKMDPIGELCTDFAWFLNAKNISVGPREKFISNTTKAGVEADSSFHVISSHYSPALDSVIYWFMQKSINLYGEALIKTLAFEKKGFGSTDSGVSVVKKFWKEKGIDDDELNISDGSGLSPQNRVTTHAQVEILKYAQKQSWYPYFYAALPEYNSMKMKSGTIKDVKGFCGYHQSKNGKEYIFSFLVNNYIGNSSALVSKMYKVLDLLK